MNPTKVFVTLAVAASLGAATAVANGSEPDTVQTATPPVAAPGVAMTPMWMQLPVAGSYPYYLMPTQPVPPYPVPQMTLPPGWGPFVMVWVPVQVLQAMPMPPVVDYGPVSETPVVVLPEPEPEPVAKVVSDTPPVAMPVLADLPAVSLTPALVGAVPALAPQEVSAAPVEPRSAESDPARAQDVGYGPIASTPVVELPDFTAPPATSAPMQPPVKANKKPVSSKKPAKKPAKTQPAAASAPTRKRMCWSNGVVAPCR
jgi:hypothetical protein